MSFLRDRLSARGIIPAQALAEVREGRAVSVAGVVLVRQRPGTAKGVVFLTIEDETGIANVVIWKTIFEAQRAVAMGARMLIVHGRIQRSSIADGSVMHLVATRLEDWTPALSTLDLDGSGGSGRDEARPPRGRHPRDVRIIPASRDFH